MIPQLQQLHLGTINAQQLETLRQRGCVGKLYRDIFCGTQWCPQFGPASERAA